MMRIGIAADHGGFGLKQELLVQLREAGHEVLDFGSHNLMPDDDYPDVVIPLAQAVATGTVDRGLAICGSGVGASVCANKVMGVRAALIHDHFSAMQGAEDDHMNVLCIGGRTAGPAVAWDLVQTFLAAEFSEDERHLRRLGKVAALEAASSMAHERRHHLHVLVVDVGGSNVKILATGQDEPRKFSSGPKMTAEEMVAGVKEVAAGWEYDAVSIGYPGAALRDRVVSEPHNLAKGWVGFDFESAFGWPVKLINDAAMQALGSYKGGKLLFLGLGTGLGSAMVVDGIVEPMELGHLPYKKGTYEDYVGAHSMERRGKKKWRKHVADVVASFVAALQPNDVVLGGGNVNELEELPPGCRPGDNADAFVGGFRIWEGSPGQRTTP